MFYLYVYKSQIADQKKVLILTSTWTTHTILQKNYCDSRIICLEAEKDGLQSGGTRPHNRRVAVPFFAAPRSRTRTRSQKGTRVLFEEGFPTKLANQSTRDVQFDLFHHVPPSVTTFSRCCCKKRTRQSN